MWNFTDAGFTSVVEYDPPATHWDKELKKNVPFKDGIIDKLPADYHPADKETLSSHVLVRARIKEDLEALKSYDPDSIETEDKLADYQYRLVMRRSAYATFMYDKVMTLDYNSHVKETIDKRAPKVAGGRYGALSAIWSACARWQPNMPWGNTVNYGGYGTGNYSGYDSATSKQYQPTTYWDKSLGKWMPIKGKKEQSGSGGVTPKALPAGNAGNPKSGSAGTTEDYPTRDQLDELLAEVDKDNPWLDDVLDVEPEDWAEPQGHLELGKTSDGLIITGEATRNTMIAQVKDIVSAIGRTCEVEALVDELQETYGTVDVETIPNDILVEMTEAYESVSTILAGMA